MSPIGARLHGAVTRRQASLNAGDCAQVEQSAAEAVTAVSSRKVASNVLMVTSDHESDRRQEFSMAATPCRLET
jgi:hypothetical protein